MVDTSHYRKAGFNIQPVIICAHFPFCFGNVLKYLMRAGLKGDAMQDLEKASHYLSMLCNRHDEMRHVRRILASDHMDALLCCSSNKYITLIREYKGERLAAYMKNIVDDDIKYLTMDKMNESDQLLKS